MFVLSGLEVSMGKCGNARMAVCCANNTHQTEEGSVEGARLLVKDRSKNDSERERARGRLLRTLMTTALFRRIPSRLERQRPSKL